jgi:2-oxoglutarate dehydrogenase E1 component
MFRPRTISKELIKRLARRNTSLTESVAVKAEPFVNGSNANYVEDMYLSWMEDPKSVHSSWASYFKQVSQNAPPGSAHTAPPGLENSAVYQIQGGSTGTSQDMTLEIKKNLAVSNLIHLYQVRGHFRAKLDPLGISEGPKSFTATHMSERQCKSVIEPDDVLNGRDDEEFLIPDDCYIGRPGETKLKLREIKQRLEDAYCNNIGVEFMHLASDDERDWLKKKFETQHDLCTQAEQRLTLERLVRSTKFEEFLAKKWVSEKRFGLEGLEMIIPCMKTLIDTFAMNGGKSFVMGMPHRGRLNVLANIIRKDLNQIFCQFDPELEPSDVGQSGDVKYHLGMSHETINHASGELINVALCANPSHLEAVDPVVIGKAKAEQFYKNDEDGTQVVPILLHGDAAFAGQGVVYETLHLSHLPFYSVGGAIHLVCNNQIGFTTDPRHSRASPYCTDVAHVVNAPIFHVNADDPDAVTYVSRVAAEFRQKFHQDVVIDLIGYRRHGHNEIDEPMFTQPRMYQVIKKHRNVLELYSETLVNKGVVTEGDVQEMIAGYEKICEDELKKAKSETKLEFRHWLDSPWEKHIHGIEDYQEKCLAEKLPDTGVPMETLQRISDSISTAPSDITLHGGLKRVLKGRANLANDQIADWSMGEAFGYGSLLMDGNHVRISGQDVERGTFSHRHHVLHDQKVDKNVHLPMSTLSENQGTYTVCNSALSEYGVMGFELGYSMVNPRSHVVWEAQFGDFVNTAQCIIDQFLSSGQTKWVRQCGLTIQLPHGYEGMGPEHSSCRIERFLQMQNDDPDEYPTDWKQDKYGVQQLFDANWIIANPTTPANCMHIHRRQIALPFRKPLILMTPKSVLRLPEARSKWSEMGPGTSFKRIIPDSSTEKDPNSVQRVMFCSGKIYYELVKEREARGFDKSVAIIRVEQLAPFPYDEIIPQLNQYKNAEIYWVQEEHKNMGFYDFCRQRLSTASNWERRVHYAGRDSAASTATGSKQVHKAELNKLMDDAFRAGAKGLLGKSVPNQQAKRAKN